MSVAHKRAALLQILKQMSGEAAQINNYNYRSYFVRTIGNKINGVENVCENTIDDKTSEANKDLE